MLGLLRTCKFVDVGNICSHITCSEFAAACINSCAASDTSSCTSDADCCSNNCASGLCCNAGLVNVGGVCVAPVPQPNCSACTVNAGCTSGICTSNICVPNNFGAGCPSAANVCGATNAGAILCDGTCSAAVPPDPIGFGTACTS